MLWYLLQYVTRFHRRDRKRLARGRTSVQGL